MGINISERLGAIAKYVPKGKKVADIGSDHALLPSYLVINGISNYVIAGEINDGPFRAAQRKIAELRLGDKVFVRKGNGLDVINEKEADVITIAGMGGALIAEILDNRKEKLQGIEILILQPNVGSELVRKWLDFNMWNIAAEEIIKESDKIYEIIVAKPRRDIDDPAYDLNKRSKEELYRLGPLLWRTRPGILKEKWIKELEKNKYILKQLEKSRSEKEKSVKTEAVKREILWITEVVSCLEKDKI